MEEFLGTIRIYLLIGLGILLTTVLVIITILCDALRRYINRKFELDKRIREAELLDKIVTTAVRVVEEESYMRKKEKLSSEAKENKALKIVLEESERKNLGNPIPEAILRRKIRAKVHELYHSE
jgi:hypothetical protein